MEIQKEFFELNNHKPLIYFKTKVDLLLQQGPGYRSSNFIPFLLSKKPALSSNLLTRFSVITYTLCQQQ